jgi:8-oxo-dGTP pyrophosphatase MutT (NUDIX family)
MVHTYFCDVVVAYQRIQTSVSWDIPGGRIDPEEALFDALRREVFEETGHKLRATPQLVAAQDIMVPAKDLHVVRLTYIAQEDVASVELSDEHDKYQWLHLNETTDLTIDPYLVAVFPLL